MADESAAQRVALAAVLRGLRVEAGLRQSDVAGRLGTAQSFVSKYESGERRLDIVQLRLVCAALGVPMRHVLLMWERRLPDAVPESTA